MIPEVLAVAIHATRPVPGKSWALEYGIKVDRPKWLRGDWRTCVGFQLVGYFVLTLFSWFQEFWAFCFSGWYRNWQPSCASDSRMSWYKCPRQSHVWYKSHTSAQWYDAGKSNMRWKERCSCEPWDTEAADEWDVLQSDEKSRKWTNATKIRSTKERRSES